MEDIPSLVLIEVFGIPVNFLTIINEVFVNNSYFLELFINEFHEGREKHQEALNNSVIIDYFGLWNEMYKGLIKSRNINENDTTEINIINNSIGITKIIDIFKILVKGLYNYKVFNYSCFPESNYFSKTNSELLKSDIIIGVKYKEIRFMNKESTNDIYEKIINKKVYPEIFKNYSLIMSN